LSDATISLSYAEAAANATSDVKDARQNGRNQLFEINKQDGTNVWFCMAHSYEIDRNYEAAGQAYEKGAYLGHRASIFRLILLKKRGFISFPPDDWILKTTKSLAKEGYIPCRLFHINEQITGSYGPLGRLTGLISIIPFFIYAAFLKIFFPNSWRIDV